MNWRCSIGWGRNGLKGFFGCVAIGLYLSTVSTQTVAGPGDLDHSFDPGSGVNGTVNSIAVQSDGKILIGGKFTAVKGAGRNRIARLNADGTVDKTFDPGGGANNEVLSVALQADGKVLIGGYFTMVDGIDRRRIARLNEDGSLDSSLDPGPGVDDFSDSAWVNSIAAQPDGKVLIGGRFSRVNGVARRNIARLHSSGAVDDSFYVVSTAYGEVRSIAVQDAGSVLAAGAFGIAKLNTDGSLDGSFNSGTSINGQVYSVAAQADGRVLIGGWFTTVSGESRNHIARLNANGTLDTGFNPGTGASDRVYSVASQENGKVLIGGEFDSFNGVTRRGIARLNTDGSLDSTFSPEAEGPVDCIAVQSDGKVLVGSFFIAVNGFGGVRIARFNQDGTADGGFSSATGVDFVVNSVVPQSDGKALIGGYFMSVDGESRNRVARLNNNGSLDLSFNPGTGADHLVHCIAVQADGKVIIGGAFASMAGESRRGISRLNADGSLDYSFNPGSGLSGFALSVAVQMDGRVLVGGNFTTVNGVSRNRIARLNADGSLDGSFNPGTGANDMVRCIAIEPDGKVIIGGQFGSFDGASRHTIARLNADGSLDGSFDPGTAPDHSVFSVALQSDGKVYTVGGFETVTNDRRGRIARLNADGTLDSSFNRGTGANDYVWSLAVQADGKVILGGAFTIFNGEYCGGVARLYPDGSLDRSFNPGKGAEATVRSIALQADGNVLIGGMFGTFNGVARGYVARLLGDGPPLVFGPMQDNGDLVARFVGTPSSIYTVEYRESLSPTSWQKLGNVIAPTNDIGWGVGVFELRDAILPSGQRFYRVVYPAY